MGIADRPGRHVGFASAAFAAVLMIAAGAAWTGRPARAADHLDPPSRTNVGANSDVAADIADVYLFKSAAGIVVALSNAGPSVSGAPPTYDRDVIYLFHLSNDGNPATDEATIEMRFGRNANNEFGVQFTGIPGAAGPLVGPVQTILTSGQVKAVAGLYDDPFFFDLQGFNDTRATGALSIRSDRNFFAGKNDTTFIVEFPQAAFVVGSTPVTVWAESRRFR